MDEVSRLEVSLGDISTPQIDRSGPSESTFVYVDISSVDRETKRISDAKSLEAEAAPSRAKQRLRVGDVLVSMTRPNLNAVAIVPSEFDGAIGSTGFHVLRTEFVEPKFLFYLVQTREFIEAMSVCVQGALYPAVRPKDIESFKFLLPSTAEQHRIVAKIEELFSELDQGVASLKTAREQLKVYRQSLLKNAFEGKLTAAWRAAHPDQLETAAALQQRIARERQARYQQQLADWQTASQPGPKPKPPKPLPLTAEELAELPELPAGWGWGRLSEIATVLSGYAFKSTAFTISGVPVIKIANVGYSRFVVKDQEYLPEPFLCEFEQFVVNPGDLLVALTRPITNDLTKVCRYPAGSNAALLNQRVAALKSILADADFLFAFLGTPIFKQFIRSKFSETLQPNLSPKDLENTPFPICCLLEQAAIVQELESKLSEADQLDLTLATALQQADALRQSILKKAFCGQLVEQDQNDEPATALLERIRAARATSPAKGRQAKLVSKPLPDC